MPKALSLSLTGCNEAGRLRAARSFLRQGFVAAASFNLSGIVLDTWSHPSQEDISHYIVQTSDGLAFCVGPLWYQGYFGTAALHTVPKDLAAAGRYDEMELRGNFVLFIHTSDSALLLNDPLGFVRLYVSSDKSFYSTSWLAACVYKGRPDLDEAAVIPESKNVFITQTVAKSANIP